MQARFANSVSAQPKFITENALAATAPGAINSINTSSGAPLANDAPVRLEPSSIRFDSVQPGTLYVMTFSVRNHTKAAQRIRIQAPTSGYFALNYIPGGPTAPGLDIRAEIECQVPLNSPDLVFTDTIVVSMGRHTVELPIFACKSYTDIRFEKVLELGSVILGQSVTKEVLFQNIGNQKGTVKFTLPYESSLKVYPIRFDLEPKQNTVVQIYFDGKELGHCRELIKVNITGALEDALLDVSGNIVEQKLSLLTENERGILDNADFGNLFFGEQRSITAYLVNSGPFPLNFAVNFEEEEESIPTVGNVNPQTDEIATYSKTLQISPLDGLVKPFAKFPVTLTFKPILLNPEKGFIRTYNTENKSKPKVITRRVALDCPDIEQKILLNMQGTLFSPFLTLTPSLLRFGECPVNDRRDILMTVTNKIAMATPFKFPTAAGFKFTPSKGTLKSFESISIIASFLPPQLGKFKTSIQMSVADDLDQIEVKLLGEAVGIVKKTLIGGTDKLPEDFKSQYKFVVPSEEVEARLEKKNDKIRKEESYGRTNVVQAGALTINGSNAEFKFPFDTASIESRERDYIYGTQFESSDISVDMSVNHPHVTRLINNRPYDLFLQQSWAKRQDSYKKEAKNRLLAKGAVDFDDPFGVNMGMDRGLDEPNIPIPLANEPLWLANRKDGEGGGGGQSRLPIDENRLIQKKYSSAPSTQAELRDCSEELSQDALKMVYASHKLIDFGKVNVGSLTAKNFVVSNDLKHSVLIRLEDLEPELQQSKYLCQMIPEGCVAGFDIYFSSRTVGKFKKPFTWKINGKHSFKVFAVAEVIPIELVMSKSQLTFEFPDHSLMPSLTQDILLTNPGNASAEFLWGSVGAFTCTPDKGTINPGKSTVISVKWTPVTGKRNEEELGLHITGGLDQTLNVAGILKETKAEFGDKRVALGVMAVGTEKIVTCQIKNTGTNPLVYFINPIDARLGIQVSPLVESILPGESSQLTISITPKSAISYDNMGLSARVRGGKQINLKLTGSSIIPKLEFPVNDFAFGSVATSSQHCLPFSISNKTSIATTLILDLNAFPEFIPNIKDSIEEVEGVPDFCQTQISTYQEDNVGNIIKIAENPNNAENATTSSAVISPPAGANKSSNNMWKILIKANATLQAELIFRPNHSKHHNFKLQLYLQGISDDKTLTRPVTAHGVHSVLGVSSLIVDFGDRVVSRDPLARVSYFLETTIKNLLPKKVVSFEIKELEEVVKEFGAADDSAIGKTGKAPAHNDLEPSQIFFVSPLKGDLAPGSSCPIRVTFQPQSSGDYSKKLQVYLKDQADVSRPYLTIACVGSGLFPRLTFNKSHVDIPTVPLNITSRASFTIFNNGYNGLSINHKVSPNIPITLDISYPDGKEVGIMTDRIRVFIACKSETPISWNGKIEFYDQDGERFFVTVSGCSDGCLLSNHMFLKSYNDVYGFIGIDNQPVKFVKKTEIAELRAIEAKRKEELRKQRSLERLRAVENKDAVTGDSVKGKQNQSPTKAKPSDNSSNNPRARANSLGSLNGIQSHDQVIASNDGVDLDRESKDMFGTVDENEVKFLLKWLNQNICSPSKKFNLDRFPQCVTDSNGELVVDCIEQMSGRRIKSDDGSVNRGGYGGGKSIDAGDDASSGTSNNRNTDKNNKIIGANRLVYKYQQILNSLIANGALLTHVNPINMVGLDDHIYAQEYELTRDKSVRFTPAMLAENRKKWESKWLNVCKWSWIEVLFQSVKIYLLSRINYKDFMKMPGVVFTTKDDLAISSSTSATASKNKGSNNDDSKNGKKKKLPSSIPREFQPSNVFTTAEAVLLAWISYHIDHASNIGDAGNPSGGFDNKLSSFSKRVVDFDTLFKEVIGFLQLIHSHIPDITQVDEPLSGYTAMTRKDDLFSLFLHALGSIRLDFDIGLSELISSSRSVVLMIMYLFFNLPSLVPKTRIDFIGKLGVPIMKKIELKNPSNKEVAYDVTLHGSSDFNLDGPTQILIPPESAVQYPIVLNARFADPVSSKLTFWATSLSNETAPDGSRTNNNGNGLAGSTLCFQLISSITGRKPVERIERDVHLFELESFKIELKNPYPKEGIFQIRLQIQFIPETVEDTIKTILNGKNVEKKKKSKTGITSDSFVASVFTKPPVDEPDLTAAEIRSLEEENEIESLFRQPFWCLEEGVGGAGVVVGKGATRFINISMLPFVLGKYICQVVFIEPQQGELCYEILANVGFPKPVEQLEISTIKETKTLHALRISSKNSSFERALSIMTENRIKNPNKKIRARSVLQNLIASPIINDETGQSNFIIEFVPSFFTYKKQISFISEYILIVKSNISSNATTKSLAISPAKFKKTLKTILEKPTGEDMNSLAMVYNSVLIQFYPEKAGQYSTQGIIYPKDNPTDIRVIELHAKVAMPDLKMILEFNGPARQRLFQEIPIANVSDRDWILYSNITGKGFSGPKSLSVPKGSTVPFEISFIGNNAGSVEGTLLLKNSDGMDSFQYHLLGNVEDPLAEENLTLQCRAKKQESFKINLPSIPPPAITTNNKKDNRDQPFRSSIIYDVETDLPYLTGDETIEVGPHGAQYEFSILSPIGGLLSGYINFTDPESGALIWYTVTVEVSAPNEERMIEAEAVVRTAVAIEITLDNPTNDVLEFNVQMIGEGLIGDSIFTLYPYKADTYELIYSPLLAGDFIGKISFQNENVGEVWYKLKLKGLPAKPIVVETAEAMVASSIIITAPVDNPLPESVVFTVTIDDTDHFSIANDRISLLPYAQSSFEIMFKPSSIGEITFTNVKLSNKKFGDILYEISGVGIKPDLMPNVTIEAGLNSIGSTIVQFHNPFPYPLPVEIGLIAAPMPSSSSKSSLKSSSSKKE
eukprot:gene8960-12082_t